MRRSMWCVVWCVACGVEPTPTSGTEVPGQAPAPEVAETVLMPESDAVLPPVFTGRLELVAGASLVQADRVLALDQGEGPRDLVHGQLTGRPSVSAARDVVAFAHTHGDDLRTSLVVLRYDGGAWAHEAVVDEGGAIDRVALHPDGSRVAFVWAGPTGGVAGLWTLGLHDGRAAGAPVRVTNTAPFTPGRPPADYVALPVGDTVRWQGEVLHWTAEDGEHSLEVGR